MRTDVRLTAVEHAPLGELVGRAAAGDTSAWNDLVDRLSPLVWAVARSHGLSRAEAADLSQRTWRRLVEQLDRIPEPERIGAQIAATALDESRRAASAAARTALNNDDTMLDLVTRHRDRGESTADELLSAAQAGDERLWALFRQLPTRCQLLLRLVVGEYPLSEHDIGELLALPIRSIPHVRECCLEQLRCLADEAGVVLGD
jgi:RNA polymerase sigma factor (sigma-70 family)